MLTAAILILLILIKKRILGRGPGMRRGFEESTRNFEGRLIMRTAPQGLVAALR
ncbi:MAG: hypothetical protein QXI60_08995 [Thermofilaceae archaeon]